MKFYGVEINIEALTALIGAITALYMTIKGKKQNKKNKEENDG